MTKEDGEKCFGVSLIFFEEVKDINICHAVHTLQKMYTTEVEVVGGASSIRRPRNESKRPRSAQKPGGTNERSRSLPRHYQQSRLSRDELTLRIRAYLNFIVKVRERTVEIMEGIAFMYETLGYFVR